MEAPPDPTPKPEAGVALAAEMRLRQGWSYLNLRRRAITLQQEVEEFCGSAMAMTSCFCPEWNPCCWIPWDTYAGAGVCLINLRRTEHFNKSRPIVKGGGTMQT
jgi:hypothetical protein